MTIFLNMIINLPTLIKQNIHKHRFSIKHCYSTLKLSGQSHKKRIILVPLGGISAKNGSKMTKYQSKSAKKIFIGLFWPFWNKEWPQNTFRTKHLEQFFNINCKTRGVFIHGVTPGGSNTRILTKMFQNVSIMSINRKFRLFVIIK